MECSVKYLLLTPGGQEAGSGEASAAIDYEKELLIIKPSSSDAMSIPFNEIVEAMGSDFTINIVLASGEKLSLSDLGYKYDDFLRVLSKQHAETIQKEMLMKETPKKAPVEAFFVYSDPNGDIIQKGDCMVTLYETGLVADPANGAPVRFPYSDVSRISDVDYALLLETEEGEKLRLSKMGRQFDLFKKALSDVLNELSLNTQMLLREMLPSADQMAVRKISGLMKDGKAARKSDIVAISPKAWKDLEDKLASAGMKKEYEFLKSLSNQEKICIGIKRGLMGELTGDYLWFLAPVYSLDPKKPGNAIALESCTLKPPEKKEESFGPGMPKGASAEKGSNPAAMIQQMFSNVKNMIKPASSTAESSTSLESQPSSSLPSPDSYYPDLTPLTQDAADAKEPAEGAGRATYLFRIADKSEYGSFKSIEELDQRVDALIKTINRCMLAINFRREPIYLDEEKLEESQYKKYRLAVKTIPELQTLRKLFMGRVTHSSPKQWEKDVNELLNKQAM